MCCGSPTETIVRLSRWGVQDHAGQGTVAKVALPDRRQRDSGRHPHDFARSRVPLKEGDFARSRKSYTNPDSRQRNSLGAATSVCASGGRNLTLGKHPSHTVSLTSELSWKVKRSSSREAGLHTVGSSHGASALGHARRCRLCLLFRLLSRGINGSSSRKTRWRTGFSGFPEPSGATGVKPPQAKACGGFLFFFVFDSGLKSSQYLLYCSC